MSSHPAVARFEEHALSGIEALIAQHQEEDLDAIKLVLGISAQQLRPEFGDQVADIAFAALIQWSESVEGDHASQG